jgi:hypothetical protein
LQRTAPFRHRQPDHESLGIAEGGWCYLTPEQIALLA